MNVSEKVTAFARPVVESLGLTLWDVVFVREGGDWVLRVVIDHPDGVSVSHCEAVSHALDPLLDAHDPIPQSYNFQVSSAGIERVLSRQSDFDHFTGHLVEVKLYAARNGQKSICGRLLRRDGETVEIEGEDPFPLASVAQVRTVLESSQTGDRIR